MAFPTPTDESNPATRLSRLIAKAISISGKKTTLDAWGDALEVPPQAHSLERTHDVAQLLSDCIQEIRLLKAELQLREVPDALYLRYISNVEHALSATNLTAPWSNTVSNYLGNDVLLSLAWCAHVLPSDGNTATDEDLQTLATLLRELEEALRTPGIPEAVRVAFGKHLVGMKRAMRVFPIHGAKPMKEAARAILADLNIDKDEIRNAASTGDESAVKNLGGALFKAWKKTAEIAGDADKVIKTGKQLVEFVSDAIDQLPS